MESDEPRGNPITTHLRTRSQTLFRVALALTALLALVVVATLPLAIRSMSSTLFAQERNPFYDLVTGKPVAASTAETTTEANRNYFNIGIVSLDPTTGLATLAISGNRNCSTLCPKVKLTLLALDDNAAERRGLPPFASLTIDEGEEVFSESVSLPVRGQPSLYPFDTYDLWLGFNVQVTGPNGQMVPFTFDMIQKLSVITLQNQSSQFTMGAPGSIDPTRVASRSDPGQLPMVVSLRFTRPAYLKILAVLLVTLISVSGLIALATRDISDLVLGVGGLILGVWGIRSVLVNQPLPGISAVDLALSYVILFLLLGLLIRLIGYFHGRAGLRWPWQK